MTNNPKHASSSDPAADEEADPEFVVGPGTSNYGVVIFGFLLTLLYFD